MAVLDDVPFFKFEVICEGNALEEYKPGSSMNASGYPQYESYIEAKSGAQFKIRTTVSEDFDWVDSTFSLSIEVDGNCLHSRYTDQEELGLWHRRNLAWLHEAVGPRHRDELTDNYFIQPFVFQKLTIVEDDSSSEQRRNEKLGTIEMSIWRCRRSETQSSLLSSRALTRRTDTVVSEKSLKKAGAVSHSVGLADSIPASKSLSVAVEYLSQHPMATYTWNYRSLESLGALGIVELESDPEPSKSPEPVKNENDPRRRVKTEAEQENSSLNQRNASALDEDDDDVEFLLSVPRKRKRVASARPVPSSLFGETIVLDD